MRHGLLLATSLFVALAMPARAQMTSREGIMLQNQILELRRDLDALAQQQGGGAYVAPPVRSGGETGSTGLEAQLLDRVQTLEDQVRRLRGELDERTNQLKQAQEDLAKQVGDINFKLSNGQSGATPPSAAPSAQSTPPVPDRPASPAEPPPPRRPELALQEGHAALARRDYAAAETAARDVLARGRTTPRAGDAHFLLAQALLGQRNYQGAAIAYDDAYNFNHKGSRAEDALLGLANALTGMGQKPAACATLDKLQRKFPTQRGQVRDAAKTLRARDGCG